jgi:hypothetical protein
MMNGILSDPTSTTSSKTFISSTKANTIDRQLVADNSNIMKRHNANINVNYNYADPKGTSLAVNADHGTYDFNSDQFQRKLLLRSYRTNETWQRDLSHAFTCPGSISIHLKRLRKECI